MEKIFISYSHANSKQVDLIEEYIKSNFEVDIDRDIRKVKPLDDLVYFMQKIREADKVITVLSDSYLKSENCMYEVTELIKDDSLREPFLEKVIPIIISPDDNPFKIYEFNTQNLYLDYWLKEIQEVESFIKQKKIESEESSYGTAFDKIINRNKDRIKVLIGINESLDQFVEGVCRELYISYNDLEKTKFQILFDLLRTNFKRIKKENKPKVTFSKKKLTQIVNQIKPASHSDPSKPEFPLDSPRFPASETKTMNINGKEVLIKDESTNPTGTHKDRMAWEIIIYYRRKLQSLINTENDIIEVPQLSLISSGSSGIAIQNLLNRFGLPRLKILIKSGFNKDVYEKLESIGCEVFQKDITIKKLKRKEVLELTGNINGIDVSFRDAIDPAQIEYYDWLSYEILNQNPTTVIVPFGSGELFTNILNVNRNECLLNKNDKRFTGDTKILRKCKFFGATTTKKDSKYYKLCSYFFDCEKFNSDQMEMYKRLEVCDSSSKVYDIDDEFYEQAQLVSSKTGISFEASSLSGIALYLQLEEQLKKEEKVLIVNTGKTKKITVANNRYDVITPSS